MTIGDSITRATTLALAIAVFAAPTALARPADVPARYAGPGEFPTRPVLDRPSAPTNSRPNTARNVPANNAGGDWATIGLGLAGSVLVVGAVAGIAGRTRHVRRARIAV